MPRSLLNLCSKLLLGASLSVSLAFAFAESAAARPAVGWVATTTDGGSANLRSGPSTNTAVQATARNGSRFDIVNEQFDATGYRWYQVRPNALTPTATVWLRADLVSFTAPFAAQPKQSCGDTVDATIQRLTAVAGTVFRAQEPVAHGYLDGPTNRPNSLRYGLSGSGAANILASPVFMNSLATNLIENCPQIGLVNIGADGSDAFINYGAMPERLVRPFQCKLGPDARQGPVSWGQSICL